MKFDTQKTVFLIDGSSFLYRAYYGTRPLHTSQGFPIHAVYSFCRTMKKLIDRFSPDYIALVWDSKGPTVRHQEYEAYKATRQAPPSDLFTQKEKIIEFATLIGLCQASHQGYEADDIMYSIARERLDAGDDVVFVTADKDMGQALTDHVFIFDAFKDEIISKQTFEQKMEFPVERLPFYFALLGDASDNIPGVHGIGKKTALELVTQFTSLEDMYANIDAVPKVRIKELLKTHEKDAFLSRNLFLLRYNATGLSKPDLHFDVRNWVKAQPLFAELEFRSLLKDLDATANASPVIFEEKIAALKKFNFKAITTRAALEALAQQIIEKGECGVDTETDGLDVQHAVLVGLSLCVQDSTAYYIPCAHQTGETQLPLSEIVAVLKPVFADARIKKYLHSAKFDMHILANHDLPLAGVAFDTLIAASLVTKDWQRIGLKNLSTYYFDEHMLTFEEVVTAHKRKTFAQVPVELAVDYAAYDALQTFRLVKLFKGELEREHMQELYDTIEFPLMEILYEMERTGIILDQAILQQLSEIVNKALATIEQDILALLGPEHRTINLNSPKQVESLLFTTLQLPPQKKSTKRTGYSTDQEVLEALAGMHPVPTLILKYRELFKLKSTYIEALPEFISRRDGRIHTSFSQTRVATGRLSSQDPNMQNIPVSGPGLMVRAAFKPQEGHVFISADYSQIELRVLAYLSQDANLLNAFACDHDIHSETAARLFDVPLADVTNDQRQIGKRINFSILYGLTPYGLSKDLDIPFGEAKKYIEKYFAQYPGVQVWMDQVVNFALEHGYVTTFWGRRRYIPAIHEKNRVLYDEAKRVAINTVAQGTAAEITKQGMIVLAKIFADEKIQAHMILQIHDELLISVPADQATRVEMLTKKALEEIVTWNVPLKVTIRRGSDWKEVSK